MNSETNARASDRGASNGGARVMRRALGALLVALCASLVACALFVAYQRRANSNARAVFRVRSRSMEPTQFGPRYVWVCPECGARFPVSIDLESVETVDAQDSPEIANFRQNARFATCPECGRNLVPSASASFRDGDLVEFAPRKPSEPIQRWELALFRDAAGRLTLKRVVGLPGERIAIRSGDVYVDGARPTREFNEILRAATPLKPIQATLEGDARPISKVERVRNDQGEVEERGTPVSNESPIPCWNGVNVAPVEFVRDFILTFVQPGDAPIAIAARRGNDAYLVEYDPASGRVEARRLELSPERAFDALARADFANAETILTRATPPRARRDRADVACFLVDGVFALLVDGEQIAKIPSNDADPPRGGIATPFVLFGREDARDFALFRDVHYSAVGNGETVVPQNRYFVLGDNSPASRDSRFADVGCVVLSGALVKRDERP